MRLTIEPTNQEQAQNGVTSRRSDCVQHKVVIEHPDDDIDLVGVIQLLSRALVAYGFSKENVREYFEELQDDC